MNNNIKIDFYFLILVNTNHKNYMYGYSHNNMQCPILGKKNLIRTYNEKMFEIGKLQYIKTDVRY